MGGTLINTCNVMMDLIASMYAKLKDVIRSSHHGCLYPVLLQIIVLSLIDVTVAF
jgi:hypothetical protein